MTAVLTRAAAPAPGDSPPVPERPARARRRALVTLVAAPGIATTTALHVATDRPLTMDESFTVLTAGRSWWALVRGCTTDPGMAMYYISLKLWSLVAGPGLEQLRLFSLVAGAAAVLGIAVLAVDRRRAWIGAVVGVGVMLAPMVREATLDARAAAFGAALAVWLVVACDRWLGDVAWPRRRVAVILGWSLVIAFVHPSTLFAGIAGATLMARFARRERDRALTRWSYGTIGVIALGAAVATIQSSVVSTVVSPGWDGVADVLAQLPGGGVLPGIAVLATVGLLLAGRSFDHDRIVRWFAAAGLLWFAAGVAMFPVQSLFVPRYFVTAATLVVLALMVARFERWSTPVIVVTIALVALGGAARLDREYGTGSGWCAISAEFADRSEPGDRVILASSAYASPMVVCLGSQGAARLAETVVSPRLEADDYDDPRTLWMSTPADASAMLELGPGAVTHFVWVPGVDGSVDDAIGELLGAGVRCDVTEIGGLSLATCAYR